MRCGARCAGDDHARRHLHGDFEGSHAGHARSRCAHRSVGKTMTKAQVASRIVEIGIVPVVRASSAEHAIKAAEAVCSGGIPIVEMTMTVPGAIEAISQLVSAGSGVLIGAGTVLDAETAQRCVDAGAEFIVSPGLDLETVTLVKRLGKLMIAGALTPTEVIVA